MVTTILSGLKGPTGIVIRNNELVISESGADRIIITTMNGTLVDSITGFSDPFGLDIAPNGTVYVADSGNRRIKTISTSNVVSTLAGNGNYGELNGPNSIAQFRQPIRVILDSAGQLFVTDFDITRIRRVTATTTSFFANAGILRGIALDSLGNFYVADSEFNNIKKITPAGFLSTYAGISSTSGGFIDGESSTARFKYPGGIVFDADDNAYISDSNNHAIRKISRTGFVTTIAGNGVSGDATKNGLSLVAARFNGPRGIIFDSNGDLIIADCLNGAIRRITTLVPSISSVTGNPGTQGGPITIVVQNFHAISASFRLIELSINGGPCLCEVSDLTTIISCTAPSVPYSGSFTILLKVNDNLNTDFVELPFSSLTYASPSITSISPVSGSTAGGYTFVIIGQNFGSSSTISASPVVTFGGINCLAPTRTSHTTLTCTVPAGVGRFIPNIILNGVNLNNPFSFGYFPPSITSISPATVYNETLLTIFGGEFGTTTASMSSLVVTLQTGSEGSYICPIVERSSIAVIQCRTPASLPAGPFSVRVSVGNQNSSSSFNGMNLLPPVISFMNISQGPVIGGVPFNLTVSNLFSFVSVNFKHTVNASYSLTFPAPECDVGLSNIVCKIPKVPFPALFSVSVTVGNLTGPEFAESFAYQSSNITSISPNTESTDGKFLFSIFGVNFGSNEGQLFPPEIYFGQYSCTDATIVSDSQITCNAPAGVGSLIPTVVLNGKNLNNSLPFNYFPPKILSISPAFTRDATLMTISGSDYGTVPTEINVILTAVSSNIDYNCLNILRVNSSLLSCIIPSNLPAGNFSVLVEIGNQNSRNSSIPLYAVNLWDPIITSMSPLQGPALGNTPINLVVQDLIEFVSVNFQYAVNSSYLVSVPAANCTQTGSNNLSCQSPVVSFPAAYNITVTVGDYTGSIYSAPFVYDRAVVSSISPRNGTTAGGVPFWITGVNFGSGCCMPIPLLVSFGPYECRNSIRVNDSHIFCNTGPGVGIQELSVSISGIPSISSNIFTYSRPVLDSVFPATAFPYAEISIVGSEFGSFSTPIIINLISSSSVSTNCASPRWISRNGVGCTIPTPFLGGTYNVTVEVGGQIALRLGRIFIIPTPPPITYNLTVFGIQKTIQDPILIKLNTTVFSPSVVHFVARLPNNGTLYLTSSNLDSVGASILDNNSPLVGNSVYYTPNRFFSGEDYFLFYAVGESSSAISRVNISIQFTNQPPSFPSPKFLLPLNETFTRYSIDLASLIFDFDEFSNFTFVFNKKPSKGKWSFNGENIMEFKDILLRLDRPNLLQLELDNTGTQKPYFSFNAKVIDSYGLGSTNELQVSGDVTCDQKKVLNTWGTGPICTFCPLGAICSPTGDFPITNQFGFYGFFITEGNETSASFLECIPPEACPVSQFKFGLQSCSPGYNGSRCGTCEKRYYSYNNLCNKCPDLNLSPILLVFLAFIVLSIVLYIAYKLSKMDLGFIGVVYTYFQALSAFYSLKLSWPPAVTSFLGFLSIFSLNIDIVSPECFQVTSPEASYEFKYYATLAIPLCVIGTGIILYLAYTLASKFPFHFKGNPSGNTVNTKRLPSVISQLLSSLFLAMRFLFLTLATTTLSIYNCTYDRVNENYYFEMAPSRLCFVQSWWWDLLPSSILAFVVYIIGTIVICTGVEVKAGQLRQRRDSDEKKEKSFTPTELLILDMTETDFPVYKYDYLYWDGVVLFRKLLIGAILNFMTHTPKSQCVLLILIFQTSLIIQNKKKPYFKDNINDLEEITLFSAIIVLLVGLVAAARERTDPVFLAFMSVFVIGFISGSGIFMSWKIIYHWYLAGVEMSKHAQSKLVVNFASLNDNLTKAKINPSMDFYNGGVGASQAQASMQQQDLAAEGSIVGRRGYGGYEGEVVDETGQVEIMSLAKHQIYGGEVVDETGQPESLDLRSESIANDADENEAPQSKRGALASNTARGSSQSDLVDSFLNSQFKSNHTSSVIQTPTDGLKSPVFIRSIPTRPFHSSISLSEIQQSTKALADIGGSKLKDEN